MHKLLKIFYQFFDQTVFKIDWFMKGLKDFNKWYKDDQNKMTKDRMNSKKSF